MNEYKKRSFKYFGIAVLFIGIVLFLFISAAHCSKVVFYNSKLSKVSFVLPFVILGTAIVAITVIPFVGEKFDLTKIMKVLSNIFLIISAICLLGYIVLFTYIMIGDLVEKQYSDQMEVILSDSFSYNNGTKVVAYRENEFRYSKLFLPEAYIAQSPEEVQYIVYIYYRDVNVGRYDAGGHAYRRECIVRIFSISENSTIYEETFKGTEPPYLVHYNTYGHSDEYGSYPDSKIIQKWVESHIELLLG